jgi:hypothetical protein
MKPEHWAVVAAIAQAQDGLVTGPQVRAGGASRASFNRDVRYGRLVRVRHQVYRVSGMALGPLHAVRAVTLAAPRLVASHETAAAVWGLMGLRKPLHVTVRSGRPPRLAGVVSHTAALGRRDCTERNGIPVTTVPRTLVDVASVLPPEWVGRLIDDAVMRGLCEYDDVVAAASGRRGAAALCELVGTGGLGTTPLERKWARLLHDAGLPAPVTQHQVVVDGRVYVLDFAWPDARVALEVDGFVAHRTRGAFDRDRLKAVALQAAGWRVVAVTATTAPDLVLSLLRTRFRVSS